MDGNSIIDDGDLHIVFIDHITDTMDVVHSYEYKIPGVVVPGNDDANAIINLAQLFVMIAKYFHGVK